MKTRYDGRKIGKYIHKEDLERMIIGTTDLWEDISDDGDGDYDKGQIILSDEGLRVLNLIEEILMDKIEKVKIGDVFYSKYFNSWCQVVGFADDDYFFFKRNEGDIPMKSQIKTDYLIENKLIFRNRELYPNQKQPEGWYCECGEPANNGEHICDDEYKKKVKPEKQEEWRERLAKYLKGTKYALWYGDEWDLSDEVEDFISQLLSERTFTKEELEWIRIKAKESKRAFTAGTRDALEEIENKAIKLLKEQE